MMLENGRKTCEECNLFEACKKLGEENTCVFEGVAHDLRVVGERYHGFVKSNGFVGWMYRRYCRKHKLTEPMKWMDGLNESHQPRDKSRGMTEDAKR